MAYSGSQRTRLGLSGTPRGLYGSFAGKALSLSGPHNPGEITRLGLAAIPRGLYGSFAGKAEAVVEPEAPQAFGGSSRRRRKGYPRWVLIDGKRYKVWSAAEEQSLLEALLLELEAEALEAAIDQGVQSAPVKRLRLKIKRTLARLDQTDDRAAAWERFLSDEDEELLMLLH